MSKIQELIKMSQEAEASIALDDVVHDLKSKEASEINNGGAKEQVRYIIEQLGEEHGIKRVMDEIKSPSY